MALFDKLSGGNEGNAAGLVARQQAFKDLGGGALKNTAAPAKPAKAAAPAPQDKVNPKAKYGDRAGEKRLKIGPKGEVLGSFKKGGKVKKTGLYRLHEGERVMNPKQTEKMDKGGLMAALAGKK